MKGVSSKTRREKEMGKGKKEKDLELSISNLIPRRGKVPQARDWFIIIVLPPVSQIKATIVGA